MYGKNALYVWKYYNTIHMYEKINYKKQPKNVNSIRQ